MAPISELPAMTKTFLHKEYEQFKMKKIMLYLIIASSLIPGILAVAQYFEANRKEKEAEKSELELKSKIDSLNTANSKLSTQIVDLQKDNLNLSHQLTETSLKLNENIIGENNIEFNIIPCSQTEYHFTLKNNDDLPVLQAKIIIEDYNEISNCPILENDSKKIIFDDVCYMKNIKQYPEVNINAGMSMELSKNLYKIKSPNDYINFVIRATTRKNTTLTYYVFKYIGDKFEKSFKVFEINKGKKVFKNEVNNLNLKPEYWNKYFFLDKEVMHRVSGKK